MDRVDLRAMSDEQLYALYADPTRTLAQIADEVGWPPVAFSRVCV